MKTAAEVRKAAFDLNTELESLMEKVRLLENDFSVDFVWRAARGGVECGDSALVRIGTLRGHLQAVNNTLCTASINAQCLVDDIDKASEDTATS